MKVIGLGAAQRLGLPSRSGADSGGISRREMVHRVVLGAGMVGLAACGVGPAAPDNKAKVPVKFSFWNARAFGPMEEKLIALYKEKNPHVTIDYVESAKAGLTAVQGSMEEVSALVIRATAGGAVDVAKVEASRTPFGLWSKKAIVGLNKYGGDKVAVNLLNTQLMQFAGNTWALTQEASVRGLSYSGAAFKSVGLNPDKPPQTWAEVIEYGQRLIKPPDKYAYIFPINNLIKTLDQVWMNGGDIVDRTYLPTKATLTGPKVQEVYQFQYDLVHKYGISPDKALTDPNLSGQAAMSYDDAGNVPTWRSKQPEGDWRLAKMFRQKVENNCQSAAAGSGLVLFNTSTQQDASWEYMKWLVSEEVQRMHAFITPIGLTLAQVGTSGVFPGHKKVATDPYWDTDPFVKGMNNCVQGIKVAPLSPIWPEVNTIMSNLNIDLVAKKVNVRDGLIEAQGRMQNLLDEDQKNNKELYATAGK
jgi:sn-glycerol 3-phosphate transport system substrate-binding protein